MTNKNFLKAEKLEILAYNLIDSLEKNEINVINKHNLTFSISSSIKYFSSFFDSDFIKHKDGKFYSEIGNVFRNSIDHAEEDFFSLNLVLTTKDDVLHFNLKVYNNIESILSLSSKNGGYSYEFTEKLFNDFNLSYFEFLKKNEIKNIFNIYFYSFIDGENKYSCFKYGRVLNYDKKNFIKLNNNLISKTNEVLLFENLCNEVNKHFKIIENGSIIKSGEKINSKKYFVNIKNNNKKFALSISKTINSKPSYIKKTKEISKIESIKDLNLLINSKEERNKEIKNYLDTLFKEIKKIDKNFIYNNNSIIFFKKYFPYNYDYDVFAGKYQLNILGMKIYNSDFEKIKEKIKNKIEIELKNRLIYLTTLNQLSGLEYFVFKYFNTHKKEEVILSKLKNYFIFNSNQEEFLKELQKNKLNLLKTITKEELVKDFSLKENDKIFILNNFHLIKRNKKFIIL